MGKFMEQQEALKALREMKRVKKEAMAKYFYDLSKLAFAAMVLGGMVSFFQDADLKWGIVIVLRMLMAISFCITGNNLLK